ARTLAAGSPTRRSSDLDTFVVSGSQAGNLTTSGQAAFTGMSTVEGAGNSTLNSSADTFVMSGSQAGNLSTKGQLAYTGMSTVAGERNSTRHTASHTQTM